jgi:photosystem II stability/assembly factor-like uncharacterized protein
MNGNGTDILFRTTLMRYNRFIVFAIFLTVFLHDSVVAQWVQGTGTNGGYIGTLAGNESYVFAGGPAGAFRSSDNGSNWTISSSGLVINDIIRLAVSDTSLFAVIGGQGGVFRSDDQGLTWIAAKDGLADYWVCAIATAGNSVFVSTSHNGIFRTTDRGVHWLQANTGMPTQSFASSFLVVGKNLYAGMSGGGIFVSKDNGGSWTSIILDSNSDLSTNNISQLAISGTVLYAVTSGIYKSTDDGAHWTAVPLGLYEIISALVSNGNSLYAASSNGGVYFSSDQGVTWGYQTIRNLQGLTSLLVNGEYLFAGMSNGGRVGGVWRRPLAEMVMSVKEVSNALPARFCLGQNYPNPFNPATTISFSLPSRSFVTLKIFDVMGRDVATVVSEEMPAGSYSRQWNASGVSSGMYFYRMQAGDFVQTKKLLLVR